MHVVVLVVIGLVALGVFAAAGYLAGKPAGWAGAAGAAKIFIWFWLAASMVNGAFGVMQAGIPIVNEVAAFVPIFGIPAAAAWLMARFLARRPLG